MAVVSTAREAKVEEVLSGWVDGWVERCSRESWWSRGQRSSEGRCRWVVERWLVGVGRLVGKLGGRGGCRSRCTGTSSGGGGVRREGGKSRQRCERHATRRTHAL